MTEDEISHEFLMFDLRRWENCLKAASGIDEVYALAADMARHGFHSQTFWPLLAAPCFFHQTVPDGQHIRETETADPAPDK